MNITQKIIHSHLQHGDLTPGSEIALSVDQTLCQDATGTLVMLELEAMGVGEIKTELSVQYVDHNLIEEDYKNADDHVFLQSAAQKFGLWYSPAGNGVSHPLHMEYFGQPGKILIGSDSHTSAGGALGMLAIGTGGLEVAMAMAGHPYYVKMPKVMGIKLVGKLPEWVSAKDIILEMLRRYGVKGGVGYVIEYYGNGLKHLDLWDRHVIANMGAELGATGTVFPSDQTTLKFMKQLGREKFWAPLASDKKATYDKTDEIDLSTLEPLIALPHSPGNVVPVREVKNLELYQAYIGSSANPGYRDLAIAAMMVEGKKIHPTVSFDINPATRNVLEELADSGLLSQLVHSGARIHQTGCNGCIGMGQAPATGRNSLRTVPRNFIGRSGTKEDSVYLCSPEVAAASALCGVMTDPRELDMPYPKIRKVRKVKSSMMQPPPSKAKARRIPLIRGPNIKPIPELKPIEKNLALPVLLKMDDNISTDEILPAGARVLPFRSNIPKISEFCFDMIDPTYFKRAMELKEKNHYHAVIAGENYGQGSSREHAALAPRYLGLQLVIAKSFARIHWQNLINFGIIPLTFVNPEDYEKIAKGDVLEINDVLSSLESGNELSLALKGDDIPLNHALSPRQIEYLKKGGLINWVKSYLSKGQ